MGQWCAIWASQKHWWQMCVLLHLWIITCSKLFLQACPCVVHYTFLSKTYSYFHPSSLDSRKVIKSLTDLLVRMEHAIRDAVHHNIEVSVWYLKNNQFCKYMCSSNEVREFMLQLLQCVYLQLPVGKTLLTCICKINTLMKARDAI